MFFNLGLGCINWVVTRIMESISANLLEQLNFKRNVVRIHPFPNGDDFGKCCYHS